MGLGKEGFHGPSGLLVATLQFLRRGLTTRERDASLLRTKWSRGSRICGQGTCDPPFHIRGMRSHLKARKRCTK